MNNSNEYRKIYRTVLDALEKDGLGREALISAVTASFNLSGSELADKSTNGRLNYLRSLSGSVINDMTKRGIIKQDSDGIYKIITEKPVAIRLQKCEEEILSLLQSAPRSRAEIRDSLVSYFGTDTTATVKDDNRLFTFIGQILKSLVNDKIIEYDGSLYRVLPAKTAQLKSRSEILSLKAEFLSLIHSRGGEFFEHYFMNLLAKFLVRCGKTVTESYTTGGSEDGGIDGIAKTVDSLGFRETIMVQTKNRLDTTTETDVRGFYGAVCAALGSRGIYAITSEFHPMAIKFLNSIDNCVGIDGDKLFSMAVDTSYGIKREAGKLSIDYELLGR